MSLLDPLINIRYLLVNGLEQSPRRAKLNLIGVVAADNVAEERTDITLVAGTTTTAPFAQPAVGATVDVAVTSTTTLFVDQTVVLPTAGYYRVAVILGATSVRLELLASIAAPGATVTTAKSVVPSGIPAMLALSVGATLYVDAVVGDDDAGTRGRADRPYATISAACADAQSGDVVQVGPGTFAEAVTLPDLAVFTLRGAGTHATVLTPPFENIALRRQSAVGLTSLTIEQLRVVVDGATEGLFFDGSNVATPGYAIGATDRGIILRDLVLEADPVDLNNVMWLKCIGHIRLQNVRTTGGSTTIYEVADAVLRNLDTGGAALVYNFRVLQPLPDGFAYGTVKLYSAKLGATTIAGYTFATIDSSSRGEALAYTPDDGGVLELGSCRFGALTVTDGGAVESYGAWFEGNSSIAAGEHNFYGGGVVGSFTTTGTGETHGYNFMVTGSIVAGVSHHVTIHYPDGTSTEYPAI